jgi:hypothetical protein
MRKFGFGCYGRDILSCISEFVCEISMEVTIGKTDKNQYVLTARIASNWSKIGPEHGFWYAVHE